MDPETTMITQPYQSVAMSQQRRLRHQSPTSFNYSLPHKQQQRPQPIRHSWLALTLITLISIWSPSSPLTAVSAAAITITTSVSQMYPGQTSSPSDFLIGPSSAPPVMVGMNITGFWYLDGAPLSGSPYPSLNSSFIFLAASGTATQVWTFSYPSLPGGSGLSLTSPLSTGRLYLQLNYNLFGDDAASFTTPSTITINFLWPSPITFSSSIPTSIYATQPIAGTLTASSAITTFLTVTVSANSGSFTQVNATFGASATTSSSFYYFAPNSLVATQLFLGLTLVDGEYWKYYTSGTYTINLIPQAIFTVSKSIRPLYLNDSWQLTCTPSEASAQLGITFYLYSSSAVLLAQQDLLPIQFTTPLVFNLIAPLTAQTLTYSFNITGSDYYHFAVPAPVNIPVVNRASILLSIPWEDSTYLNQTVPLTLTPTETAMFNGVNITLYVNGTLKQTSTLVGNGTLIFNLRTINYVGAMGLTWLISGDDSDHFLPMASHDLVVQRAYFIFTNAPTSLLFGAATTFSVQPSLPPIGSPGYIGLNIAVSGGSLSIVQMVWDRTNYTTPVVITFTAPLLIQYVSMTFSVFGPPEDLTQYSPPNTAFINIQGRVSVVLSTGAPVGINTNPDIFTSQSTTDYYFALSGAGTNGYTFNILANASWVISGVDKLTTLNSITTTCVGLSTNQSFPFTVPNFLTLPANVIATFPSGFRSSAVTLQWKLYISGTDASRFIIDPTLLVQVTLPYKFTMPIPTFVYSSQVLQWSLSPSVDVEFDITISLTSTNGLLYPSIWDFDNTSYAGTIAPVNYTAPTLPLLSSPQSVTISAIYSGTERNEFVVQGLPATMTIFAQQTFNVVPSSGLIYTNQPFNITITPTAPANLTGITVNVRMNSLVVGTLTFPKGYSKSLTLVVIAPNVTQTVTFSFFLSGSDLAHFAAPPSFNYFISPTSPFNFVNMPTSLASTQTTTTIYISPQTAPNKQGVTLSMTTFLSGQPVTTLASSQTFTFSPNTIDTWSFTITSPHVMQDTPVNLVFTLSGSDATHFILPSPIPLVIKYPKANFTVTGLPPIVYSGFTYTVVVTMYQPEFLGSLCTLSLVSAVAPNTTLTSFIFLYSSTQSATLTFPNVNGSAQLTWNVSDSLHFAPPPPASNFSMYPIGYWGQSISPCLCGSRGTCDQGLNGTGNCTCQPLWVGPTCATCATGYYGANCTKCTVVCPIGVCNDGVLGDNTCRCPIGFTGASCNQCATGFWGPSCLACPWCVRGTCRDGITGTGCVCNTGWQGSQCDQPIPGALVAFNSTFYAYDNTLLPFTPNASFSSFSSKIESIPLYGALFQTDYGVIPTDQILDAGTVVSDRLNRLFYQLPTYDYTLYHTTPMITFMWQASSPAGGLSSNGFINIIGLHINAAPVLTGYLIKLQQAGTPYFLTISQNTVSGAFDTADFLITDADAGSLPITMSLISQFGFFLFDTTSTNCMNTTDGVPITNSSALLPIEAYSIALQNLPHVLNITSSQANLNRIINCTNYAPAWNYYGSDSFSLLVADGGNSGTNGTEQSVSVSNLVSIWIKKVNQPITISPLTATFSAFQDQPFQGPWNLTVTDVDAEYYDIEVTISALFGTVSLNLTALNNSMWYASPTFSVGTGTNSALTIFRANIETVNFLLANFTYLTNRGWYGSEFITVRVNDLGSGGLGGATIATATINLNVAFVDTPPVPISQSVTMLEDSTRYMITLTAQDLNPFPTGTPMSFNITSLPNPAIATLWQFMPFSSTGTAISTTGGEIGKQITTVPTLVNNTDSTGQQSRVLVRLTPRTYGNNIATFNFTARKTVSGVAGNKPGVITISAKHVNHLPFVNSLVSLTGNPDPNSIYNFYLFANVFPSIETYIKLNGTDYDVTDTLSFYISSIPTVGALYQFNDNDPTGTFHRGAQITSRGTKVTSKNGYVIYLCPALSSWDPVTLAANRHVGASFTYTVYDGQVESDVDPTVNLVVSTAIYPIAVSRTILSPENYDVAVNFTVDSSQTILMQLASVTITSLPANGTLYLRASEGVRGRQITTVPFVMAVAGTPVASVTGTTIVDTLALYYAPLPYDFGDNYANFTYTVTAQPSSLASQSSGMISFNISEMSPSPTTSSLSFFGINPLTPFQSITFPASSVDPAAVFNCWIMSLPTQGRLTETNRINIISSVPYGPITGLTVYYEPNATATSYYTSFGFAVGDVNVLSGLSLVELYVGTSAIPPVSTAQTVTATQGSFVTISLSSVDPKGILAPSIQISSFPSLGGKLFTRDGLAITASANYIIQPDGAGKYLIQYQPGFNGFGPAYESFTFHGIEQRSPFSVGSDATVTLNVNQLNLPPTMWSGSLLIDTLENTPILFELNGTDPGIYIIQANVTSLPLVGRLAYSICGNNALVGATITTVPTLLTPCTGDSFPYVWYVPVTNQWGSTGNNGIVASFNYSLFDGILSSTTNTQIILSVEQQIYAPIPISSTATTTTNQPILLQANARDINGAANSSFTFDISTFPTHGKLYQYDITINDGSNIGVQIRAGSTTLTDLNSRRFWYVPAYGYTGTDTIFFTATLWVSSTEYITSTGAASLQLTIQSTPGVPVTPSAANPLKWNLTQSGFSVLGLQVIDPDSSVVSSGSMALTITALPLRGTLYQVSSSYRPTGFTGTTTGISTTPTATSGYGVISTGSTCLTFPTPFTLGFNYTDSVATALASSPLTTPITQVGTIITHPNFLIGFVPETRQSGDVDLNFFYAQFNYSAQNRLSNVAAITPGTVNVYVYAINLTTIADSFQVNVLENVVTPIYLTGLTSYDTTEVGATILTVPTRGILCQTNQSGPVVGSPCGVGYGTRIYPGTTVTDTTLKIWYSPPLDGYNLATSFTYQTFDLYVDDGVPISAVTSSPATVSLTVQFVNQPPTSSASVSDQKYFTVSGSTQRSYVNLTQFTRDPDDALETLTYLITGMNGRGRVWYDTVNSQGVRVTQAFNQFSSFPITLPSGTNTRKLTFDANNEGYLYPYSWVTFTVVDSVGHNVSDYLQFVGSCDAGLVLNVWTNGSLCLPCPYGSQCATDGSFMPVAYEGFWRSDITTSDNQPIFVACSPAEACIGAEFTETAQCADGYEGRLCGACQTGYYRFQQTCSQCTSKQAFNDLIVAYAIPIGSAILVFGWLLTRQSMNLSFIGITWYFLQLLAAFSRFQLPWPEDVERIFHSLSVLLINIEWFQLSCWYPGLSFMQEWLAFMLIPIIFSAFFLLTFHFFGQFLAILDLHRGRPSITAATLNQNYHKAHRVAVKDSRRKRADPFAVNDHEQRMKGIIPASQSLAATLAMYTKPPAIPPPNAARSELISYGERYQAYLNDLAHEMHIQPTGPIILGVPQATLADIQMARFHNGPLAPLTWKGCAIERFHWAQNKSIHVILLILSLMYLSLCIRAMEPLKCSRQDDGSLVMDAYPSVRCDRGFGGWTGAAIFFSVLYCAGIPLLFALILFLMRPPFDSVRACGNVLFWPIQLLSVTLRRSIFRKQYSAKLRESTVNGARTFMAYQRVHAWQVRFDALTAPFQKHFFFWALPIKLFAFWIAIIAVWLGDQPLYQAAAGIGIIGLLLIAEWVYRPYLVGSHMNELSRACLSVAAFILYIGLLFQTNSTVRVDDVVYESKYKGFSLLLNHLIKVAVIIICLMVLNFFRRHLSHHFNCCSSSSESAKHQQWRKELDDRDRDAAWMASIERPRYSAKFGAPLTVETRQLVQSQMEAAAWMQRLEELYSTPAPPNRFVYDKEATMKPPSEIGGNHEEELKLDAAGRSIPTIPILSSVVEESEPFVPPPNPEPTGAFDKPIEELPFGIRNLVREARLKERERKLASTAAASTSPRAPDVSDPAIVPTRSPTNQVPIARVPGSDAWNEQRWNEQKLKLAATTAPSSEGVELAPISSRPGMRPLTNPRNVTGTTGSGFQLTRREPTTLITTNLDSAAASDRMLTFLGAQDQAADVPVTDLLSQIGIDLDERWDNNQSNSTAGATAPTATNLPPVSIHTASGSNAPPVPFYRTTTSAARSAGYNKPPVARTSSLDTLRANIPLLPNHHDLQLLASVTNLQQQQATSSSSSGSPNHTDRDSNRLNDLVRSDDNGLESSTVMIQDDSNDNSPNHSPRDHVTTHYSDRGEDVTMMMGSPMEMVPLASPSSSKVAHEPPPVRISIQQQLFLSNAAFSSSSPKASRSVGPTPLQRVASLANPSVAPVAPPYIAPAPREDMTHHPNALSDDAADAFLAKHLPGEEENEECKVQ